jgi:hypothetical protein
MYWGEMLRCAQHDNFQQSQKVATVERKVNAMAKGWRKDDYNRQLFGQKISARRLTLQWSLGHLAQLSSKNGNRQQRTGFLLPKRPGIAAIGSNGVDAN